MLEARDQSARNNVDQATYTHDFCKTDTRARLSSWTDVLDLQVKLFFSEEAKALALLPAWRRAGSVLDVGCGNGEFLAMLATTWPSKRYSGLDRSSEFITVARQRVPEAGFTAGDLELSLADEAFDVVLMRFVVQHLRDWKAVLGRMRSLLTERGSLVVVEPNIARFSNSPALPRFEGMLEGYGREAAARGCLRNGLDELAERSTNAGWTVASSRHIEVRSRGRDETSSTLMLYHAWAALCEVSGYVTADFEAIHQELDAWGEQSEAASLIGLSLLELQPDRP